MGAMASQITSLTIVYSTVYSGTDQSEHQSSASLAFVRGIHRWPMNSPHKWPARRKMFLFNDVIMAQAISILKPIYTIQLGYGVAYGIGVFSSQYNTMVTTNNGKWFLSFADVLNHWGIYASLKHPLMIMSVFVFFSRPIYRVGPHCSEWQRIPFSEWICESDHEAMLGCESYHSTRLRYEHGLRKRCTWSVRLYILDSRKWWFGRNVFVWDPSVYG